MVAWIFKEGFLFLLGFWWGFFQIFFLLFPHEFKEVHNMRFQTLLDRKARLASDLNSTMFFVQTRYGERKIQKELKTFSMLTI